MTSNHIVCLGRTIMFSGKESTKDLLCGLAPSTGWQVNNLKALMQCVIKPAFSWSIVGPYSPTNCRETQRRKEQQIFLNRTSTVHVLREYIGRPRYAHKMI